MPRYRIDQLPHNIIEELKRRLTEDDVRASTAWLRSLGYLNDIAFKSTQRNVSRWRDAQPPGTFEIPSEREQRSRELMDAIFAGKYGKEVLRQFKRDLRAPLIEEQKRNADGAIRGHGR